MVAPAVRGLPTAGRLSWRLTEVMIAVSALPISRYGLSAAAERILLSPADWHGSLSQTIN